MKTFLSSLKKMNELTRLATPWLWQFNVTVNVIILFIDIESIRFARPKDSYLCMLCTWAWQTDLTVHK